MTKISVIPNPTKDSGLTVTKKLIELLSGKAEIYMPDGYITEYNVITVPEKEIYKCSDIVIVIGGDGTIISSAVSCAENNTPLLGVNLGRIGFMSELEVSSLEEGVNRLLRGEYTEEKRMMMDIEVIKKNGERKLFHALNDIVVQKAGKTKLIGIELFSGGEKISHYVADGLIVSTPTGSTGYNLSAGGPVVNPLMSLYITTAICPHMLSCRPAVMPAEQELLIKADYEFDNHAEAVVDGEIVCNLENGDEIKVTKSEYTTKLIKIVKRSFYDTLIEKLS